VINPMIGTALASSPDRRLDWFFVLVLVAMTWAAIRFARADYLKAHEMVPIYQFRFPPWLFSLPMYMVAASLAIAALGTAVGEDYWELRAFVLVFVLWALSFALYAGLLYLSVPGDEDGTGRGPILFGLILLALCLFIPGLVDRVIPWSAIKISHGWSLLVAVAVALLLLGILKGHSSFFSKYAAGLGILQLAGWGLTELFFARPSFPWLVRVWNLTLSDDYIASFSMSPVWRVIGAIKVLSGITALVFLIIDARRACRPTSPGRSTP
jgi:hypothetical protein